MPTDKGSKLRIQTPEHVALIERAVKAASDWQLQAKPIEDAWLKSLSATLASFPSEAEIERMTAEAAKQAAEAYRLMSDAMNSPRMHRYRQQRERAAKGDYEALLEVLDDSFTVLGDDDISRQIYLLDPDAIADRKILEQIAKSVRSSLLTVRKPGRRPRTPLGLVKLVPIVQDAFESAATQVKRRYRNPAARSLDVKAISEHVALSVPADSRDEIRKAVVHVLMNNPKVGKGFGFAVVAKTLSRSSRWIRFTRKRKQL